jgi:hypothetical protein
MLTREIEFSPAYDKRNVDGKNYGIHGVDIKFLIRNDKGVIQFVIYTDWHLPHVIEELKFGIYRPHTFGADLGYHSPKPLYEGQTMLTDNCHYLNGPCYYDGSGLQAEEMYQQLIAEGSKSVWKSLEEIHKERFGDVN